MTPDTVLEETLSLEERLARTPRTHTIKGLYVERLVHALARPWAELAPMLEAPPPDGHYRPQVDYPQTDYARLAVLVARKQFPNVSMREGIRRLERATAQVFLESSFGRLLGGLLSSPLTALRMFPAAYRLAQHGGSVRAVERRRGARLEVRDFAPWVDCAFVGVLEGALVLFGRRPWLEIDLLSDTDADFEVEWT